MAEKRRFLDVWIVESNTVYREVPVTVVMDWTQQGRLLADDMLRPSGTEKWQRLGDTRALAAFLPKSEPMRADDQAEALEPVEVDFTWKRSSSEEDDDPDMIPLIDISLVLLIFFMMTSAVVVASSRINVPGVENPAGLSAPGSLWIGIDRKPDGSPVYSLGEGERGAAEGDQDLTEAQVLQKVAARVKALSGAEVRITGDKLLPYEVIKRMTVELEPYRRQGYIKTIRAEVSEARP
jgi:biopolymer transport protein ExbD